MATIRERLIHLHHCRGVTWKTIYLLLKEDPSLSNLYNLSERKLHHSFQIPNHTSKYIMHDLQSDKIHEQIRQYQHNQIDIVTIMDEQYPFLLKQIYDPPWVLYAKGNLNYLQENKTLAVVGSRQASQYGLEAIKVLLPKLIKQNWLIVSGLARGIDGEAHRTTMNLGGKTIAVIAGGFFHIYPSEHKNLAIKMMEEQLILSEYPPTLKPDRWHFPYRNRIISGLSRGTILIEAKRKSGSLITASYALKEGRDVFAVPGHIFSPNSIGTNEWIQQGAKLVQDANDITNEYTL